MVPTISIITLIIRQFSFIHITISGIHFRDDIFGRTPGIAQTLHSQRFQLSQLTIGQSFISGYTSQFEQEIILCSGNESVVGQKVIKKGAQDARRGFRDRLRSRFRSGSCRAVRCGRSHVQFLHDLCRFIGMLLEEFPPREKLESGLAEGFLVIRRITRTSGILATHVTRKINHAADMPRHHRISLHILFDCCSLDTHHHFQTIVRYTSPTCPDPRHRLQLLQELLCMSLRMVDIKHGIPTPRAAVLQCMASLAIPRHHQAGQFVLQLFGFTLIALSH